MSLLSLLQELDGKEIAEDKGEPIVAKLMPGLSRTEMQDLQGMIPCTIPSQMQEVLSLTRGFTFTEAKKFLGFGIPIFEGMDFSGLSMRDSFEMPEIFPHGLPVAADGCGNFWVVDLDERSKDWSPVFYACHDPPVIIYQANSFEEFVVQLISFASNEERSPIELVHDQYAMQIWNGNPGVIAADDAARPGDPDLTRFAASLPKGYMLVDLRRARTGEGFSWGRFGAQTELKRDGTQRLFAYRKPPGFFDKLFRR